jgi:glycosyltransferase involved in cell wall biosynthesis
MKLEADSIVFLGFNDPRFHVRGVENVIRLQSLASESRAYYLFRGERSECFRWNNLIAISIPTNYIYAFWFIRRILARITERHGLPIIHAHHYILALLVFSRKFVFTVHDALAYHKRSVGAQLIWLYSIIEIIVYCKAKKIHAISHFAWNNAVGHRLFQSKMAIIYNSVWTKTDVTGTDTEFAENTNYYLVVRSIEERANIGLIIDFAEFLKKQNNRFTIKVAGKGPLLNHYREIIESKDLSNIEFLGYVDDLSLDRLYRHCSCVIMPALYGEGFGLPLIEAYSRGVPAVGSSVCAVPEVIYSSSLLFDTDIISLTTAIHEASKIDRMVLKEYFNNKFGQAQVLASYRKMYEELSR